MTDMPWNLRMPDQIRQRIEPIARADGRTASQMARRLLELSLNERNVEHTSKKQPPVPWTQVDRGVFPPDHTIKLKLVDVQPPVEEAWRDAIASGRLDGALASINYLQATPLMINKPILRLLHKQAAPAIPPKPPIWRTRQRAQYMKQRAKAREWGYILAEADILTRREPFYVPLKLDPRGRLNGVCHFSFQRADYVRALILFGCGEPIGDGDGLLCLMAHASARADGVGDPWIGSSKPSALNLEGRVAWAKQNYSRLMHVGESVILDRDLAPHDLPGEDDEPFQFAAACSELAKAHGNPDFVTQLPLIYDGSCNGLQHICYIMRAPEGRLVNLLPSETKEDCYNEVVKKVAETCGDLLKDIPHPRKILKPTGMTYGFGSNAGGWGKNKKGEMKPFGMTAQVVAELEERGLPTTWVQRESGAWSPATEEDLARMKEYKDRDRQTLKAYKQSIMHLEKAGRDKLLGGRERELSEQRKKLLPPTRGAQELAKAAFNAIEKLVPAAATVRGFLEDLAGICAQYNIPLRWWTPLPVVNDYYHEITCEVSFQRPGGPRYHFIWPEGYSDKIDTASAKRSVTANFVHSCDAAHLHRVGFVCRAEQIAMLPVHDCYAFLATRAGRGNQIIRAEFRLLHTEHDMLKAVLESARRDLPDGVELPKLPERGDLDPFGIDFSFFAFS